MDAERMRAYRDRLNGNLKESMAREYDAAMLEAMTSKAGSCTCPECGATQKLMAGGYKVECTRCFAIFDRPAR
jgi:hypothetical protein